MFSHKVADIPLLKRPTDENLSRIARKLEEMVRSGIITNILKVKELIGNIPS